MQLNTLRATVLNKATNADWIPPRNFLTEVGNNLPRMAVNDPLREWWSEMTMAYLQGSEGPTRKTRAANQIFLLAARPSHKDVDDLDLDF